MKLPVNAAKCPSCGGYMKHVVDSRPHRTGNVWAVKRRRQCSDCGARHNTFEMLEEDILFYSIELRRKLEDDLARAESVASGVRKKIARCDSAEEKAG